MSAVHRTGDRAPTLPRRTQAERTAATRTLLLDTTVQCLADVGYAGTTTTEVARRSGLSRGAQLHHFPSRAELVAAAVEHLFTVRLAEFRTTFAAMPDTGDRLGASIDLLWSMFDGPTFAAWLELAVAGRTDPELHQHVLRVSEAFSASVEQTFIELFPPTQDAGLFYEVAPTFIFALFEGLATHRLAAHDDPGKQQQVVDAVKRIAALTLPTTLT